MAALIPDDWDGISFDCVQIQWPSSEQWRAILLGQLNEAYQTGYWEGNEAERQDASLAVQNALDATFSEGIECEEVAQVSKAFMLILTATNTIPGNAWSPVRWGEVVYSVGSPGISLDPLNAGHQPTEAGVWVYKAILWSNTASIQRMHASAGINAAVDNRYGFTFTDERQMVHSGWHYQHVAAGDVLNCMAYSTGIAIDLDPDRCAFFGAKVA